MPRTTMMIQHGHQHQYFYKNLRLISVLGILLTGLLLVHVLVVFLGKNVKIRNVLQSIGSDTYVPVGESQLPVVLVPDPALTIDDPPPTAAATKAKDSTNDGGRASTAQASIYVHTANVNSVRRFGEPGKETRVQLFYPHKIEGEKRKGAADKVVVCVVPKGSRYVCKHHTYM